MYIYCSFLSFVYFVNAFCLSILYLFVCLFVHSFIHLFIYFLPDSIFCFWNCFSFGFPLCVGWGVQFFASGFFLLLFSIQFFPPTFQVLHLGIIFCFFIFFFWIQFLLLFFRIHSNGIFWIQFFYFQIPLFGFWISLFYFWFYFFLLNLHGRPTEPNRNIHLVLNMKPKL